MFPQIKPASFSLSPAVEREALHQRDYLFNGYRRADGLFDIEGRIVDRKEYAFPNAWRGEIQPGIPLHDMAVRLTIDKDYVIQFVEVATLSSPFSICPNILPQFQKLVGARMAKGWSKILAERVGGIKGCTHINEMLRLMATVAFQTLAGQSRREAHKEGRAPDKPKPGFIDSCHALAANSPVVAEHWPEFYQEKILSGKT